MGWLYPQGASRRHIIEDLISTDDNDQRRLETIAYCTRGNVLWSVVEITRKQEGDRKERFISCCLMRRERGTGWGYKRMDESMGPCYYSCPLSYLDLAPVAASQKWRDAVKAYHSRAKRLTLGDRVRLVGSTVPWVEIVSVRPLLGRHEGTIYKVPRRLLGERFQTQPKASGWVA